MKKKLSCNILHRKLSIQGALWESDLVQPSAIPLPSRVVHPPHSGNNINKQHILYTLAVLRFNGHFPGGHGFYCS